MTQLGEGVAIGVVSSSDPNSKPKRLKASIVEFTWGGGIKVSEGAGSGRSTIETPHWKEGLNVADGEKSKRPGVLIVGGAKGTGVATAKIRIDENLNVSGDGALVGRLGMLEFNGSCPTAAGEHTVQLTIGAPPRALVNVAAETAWGLDVPNMGSSVMVQNRPRLEVFTVLDTPAAYYDPAGVWIEALRFLFDKIVVKGQREAEKVASQVTMFCHGKHNAIYDTKEGRSRFGVGPTGGTFNLGSYIGAAAARVNCYDQAGAIQSLCGAVGVPLSWIFLEPYGFINETNLVGVGYCNNPFFSSSASTRIVPRNDIKRSLFGNHAFCNRAGKILDACAGPHIGNETPAEYCLKAIDKLTTLYTHYSAPYDKPGVFTDMLVCPGVSAVA